MEFLLDALIDTAKQLPFLFVAYVLVEWLEGSSGLSRRWLGMLRKAGPFSGALMGVVPQCGFSVFSTSLFARRVITTGTLLAVYLSTSDEAVPLMLAHPAQAWRLLPLLAVKLVYAMIVGFLVDLILRRRENARLARAQEQSDHHAVGCCGHDCETERKSAKSLLLHPFYHTLKIALYIFLLTALLNFALERIGTDRLTALMLGGSALQPLITALIGLIPNCAASVAITQLYIAGSIGFGSVVAGLCASAGLGLLVLFRENKNLRENILLLLTLYASSAFVGIVLTLVVR